MSEKTDAIKLAKHVLEQADLDPDGYLSMMSRQFLRALETIEALHKQLQGIDWNGRAELDLIHANRDEILKKHEEAYRRVRDAIVRDDRALAFKILDALTLFHPMHAESWVGWPEVPFTCPKCGGQRIHERLKGYQCPRCD